MPKGRPTAPPDETESAREAALFNARHSIARGDFDAARQHISDAERLGAPTRDVRSLRQSITRGEQSMPARARKGFWIGFLISALGYFVVCFTQPLQWTIPVWAALVFGLIPLLSGFAAGRVQGPAVHSGDRFRAAFFGACWPMFWYTLITLIVLRSRLQSGPDSGQLFLVVMFVSILYAIGAGLVAGLVGSRLAALTTSATGRRSA
jgi:hypothetical protein